MSEKIVRSWLIASAHTASANDLDAHMNLISKNVSVTGISGFELIGYDDWAAQCEHEFSRQFINKVEYTGLKILADTPERIMFKTLERVEASDGTTQVHGIEALIEQEEDGVWRLVQERVMPDDESRHDGLLANTE